MQPPCGLPLPPTMHLAVQRHAIQIDQPWNTAHLREVDFRAVDQCIERIVGEGQRNLIGGD